MAHADDDFEDLYQNAPCGHLSMLPDGRIIKANTTLAAWTGVEGDELIGKRLSDLLNVAGRIFYETHVAPLLRMQGFFNEFALDMVTAQGERLPVIANAVERRGEDGQVLLIRLAVFKAEDRRLYERELLKARTEADRAKQELEQLYAASESFLKSERELSELREQFIAVLGHDLRNPLAALSAGARLLVTADSPEKAQQIEAMMQRSVGRMAKMIDGVMDFARGRLGGGLALGDKVPTDLEPVLHQVVAEIILDHPDRTIESTFELKTPVTCDPARIAQMFSNLLGNAVTHGEPAQPIRVHAATYASSFELYVTNAGEAISDDIREHLFQPFYRGSVRPSKQGLGLGLYIASEIAKAHNGALDVTSTEKETRFTFVMPLS
jgi:phosphoserine phosphatase RsbU/P